MSTPTSSSLGSSGITPASRKIPLICSGHSRPVPELAYSKITPDGFFIISACLDGKAMLRHGETGDWIGTFVGHKGAVWSAHVNSNITKVVTGSADYNVKLWSAITGEEVHNLNHGRIVKTVQFSPDDKRLLTGGQDKIIRVFDLNKLDSEPIKIEGFNQPIKTAVWTSDGNYIIVAPQEPSLKIYDMRTLTPVKTHTTKSGVTSVDIGNKFICTAAGKDVQFWDLQSFELQKSYSMPIEINSAALSLDASTFAVGGVDHWLRVFDFNTMKELEVLKGHHGPVHCVRYSPDGATFASGSEDGTIRLWQSGEVRPYGLWQDSKSERDPPQEIKP